MENVRHKFYFDMDGVLADFDIVYDNKDVLKLCYELKQYYKDAVKLELIEDSDLDIKPLMALLKNKLAGEQKNAILKSLKKKVSNLRNDVFKYAMKKGFFLDLPVLKGAKEMLEYSYELTGVKPDILTAPVKSIFCEIEKEQWMQKHFKGLYLQFHCTPSKFYYAKPNHILIDDRVKFIDPFRTCGGKAILHTNVEDTLKEMKLIIL